MTFDCKNYSSSVFKQFFKKSSFKKLCQPDRDIISNNSEQQKNETIFFVLVCVGRGSECNRKEDMTEHMNESVTNSFYFIETAILFDVGFQYMYCYFRLFLYMFTYTVYTNISNFQFMQVCSFAIITK